MYPQQPPNGPYQGGGFPASQYSQGPGPYGGYPPPTPGPVKMPGTAITVRVLMFIGGVSGLLLGGLMWLFALMAANDGQIGQDFRAGMGDSGLPLSGAEAGVFFGLMGAVPFVYGALSTGLAALMGRRSPGILWSVVVFQTLAPLALMVSVVAGNVASLIPVAFAVTMVVLMLLQSTRAYYTRPPVNPYAS